MSNEEARGSNSWEQDAKAPLIERFRGPVARNDSETVDFWRGQTSAMHAEAMISLSAYAEQMVAQTGHGKNPDEMFPGFTSVNTGRGHRS